MVISEVLSRGCHTCVLAHRSTNFQLNACLLLSAFFARLSDFCNLQHENTPCWKCNELHTHYNLNGLTAHKYITIMEL